MNELVILKEVNIFINVDLATVFMLEKSLSSSSSLQMTFIEVKCMIRMISGVASPKFWNKRFDKIISITLSLYFFHRFLLTISICATFNFTTLI